MLSDLLNVHVFVGGPLNPIHIHPSRGVQRANQPSTILQPSTIHLHQPKWLFHRSFTAFPSPLSALWWCTWSKFGRGIRGASGWDLAALEVNEPATATGWRDGKLMICLSLIHGFFEIGHMIPRIGVDSNHGCQSRSFISPWQGFFILCLQAVGLSLSNGFTHDWSWWIVVIPIMEVCEHNNLRS